MYTIIILFYVSLIAMIAMIFLKRREINTGKRSPFSKIGDVADHIFLTIFNAFEKSISFVNKHTFMALAHFVAFHVLFRVRKVYVEIKHRFLINPHGKKLIDAVRGKGEIHRHGASFYLRRISE